jgi:hypothetical protein
VAIESALASAAPSVEARIAFLHYDDLFRKYPVTLSGTLEALAKLTVSGLVSPFRPRALERGVGSSLKWTAGMVVKWVEDAHFRRDTRRRVADRLRSFSAEDSRPPDVVLAHSLGSLVVYDTLTAVPGLHLPDTQLVTFGSQIANPFVSGQFFAGRVQPLETVARWVHLYNPEDSVFTAPIRLAHPRFQQIVTPFDEPGLADHSAPRYLGHPLTTSQLWSDFEVHRAAPRLFRRPSSARAQRPATPRRRALLVGINAYPAPEDCLEGCVNDVYLMSSLLQESGYEPEDIRIVLDERATAAGIRTRLEWLLEGISEEDTQGEDPVERVFYYSGHGAQMPGYGAGDRVDRMDETLVPHDFDWSPERALTDDAFHELYAQLPYGLRFLSVFDCCHSGGMTRDGGPRVRGLDPPDDIRHRALRWEQELEMWTERDLRPVNRAFQTWVQRKRKTRMTSRLGHAMVLRELETSSFNRRRRQLGHFGPYMPLLLYACREDQVALEYRHGSISHGAFTYALVKHVRTERKRLLTLPTARRQGELPNFEQLVRRVRGDLRRLGYEQHPQIAGPVKSRRACVPFLIADEDRRRKPRRR